MELAMESVRIFLLKNFYKGNYHNGIPAVNYT